jgi:phage shock protein C
MRGGKFTLDRTNGKLFGVCAGIANATGIDATWVRVALVVSTLAGAWPWTVIAYGAIAFAARVRKPRLGAGDAPAASAKRFSTRDMNASMRDIDRRLAEVDSYVASTDSSLAREIERLR